MCAVCTVTVRVICIAAEIKVLMTVVYSRWRKHQDVWTRDPPIVVRRDLKINDQLFQRHAIAKHATRRYVCRLCHTRAWELLKWLNISTPNHHCHRWEQQFHRQSLTFGHISTMLSVATQQQSCEYPCHSALYWYTFSNLTGDIKMVSINGNVNNSLIIFLMTTSKPTTLVSHSSRVTCSPARRRIIKYLLSSYYALHVQASK